MQANTYAVYQAHNVQNVMDSPPLTSLPSEAYLAENEKIAFQVGKLMTQQLLLETGFTEEKLHRIRKTT